MEFSRSDEVVAIQDLARRIFVDHASDAALRRFDRGESGHDVELWKRLAESGLLGVALPESCGGSALGLAGLCAVFEEQGAQVLAQPLLATIVLAALPLAAFGSAAQQMRWLPGVVTGDVLLSGVLPAPSAPGHGHQMPACARTATGWTLNGQLAPLPYGRDAAALLIPARTEHGAINVFLVPATNTTCCFDRQWATNHEPLDVLSCDGMPVTDGDLVGVENEGQGILDWVADRACTAMTFMQTGVLAEAVRRTAEYTIERYQFGKSLAAFQAVAHRAADAYVDLEALRPLAWQAAWRLDAGLPAADAIAAAAWWACEAGHRIGHAAQHLHGGIGADLDYPIHRYFLWAKHIEFCLGGGQRILAGLGRSLARQSIEIGL